MLWPLSVVLVANREKLPGCEYQRTVGYPNTSWASCIIIATTAEYVHVSGEHEWRDVWRILILLLGVKYLGLLVFRLLGRVVRMIDDKPNDVQKTFADRVQ